MRRCTQDTHEILLEIEFLREVVGKQRIFIAVAVIEELLNGDDGNHIKVGLAIIQDFCEYHSPRVLGEQLILRNPVSASPHP